MGGGSLESSMNFITILYIFLELEGTSSSGLQDVIDSPRNKNKNKNFRLDKRISPHL